MKKKEAELKMQNGKKVQKSFDILNWGAERENEALPTVGSEGKEKRST